MTSKFKKIVPAAMMLSVMFFSSNVRAEIPSEGMVGGVFGSYGIATKANKNTIINMGSGAVRLNVAVTDVIVGDMSTDCGFVPKIPKHKTGPFTLDAEKDSTWDVGIYAGYLMGNGLEGGLELGYRKYKAKDKTIEKNELEVVDMSALLSGTFYVDMGSSIHPYVNAAIGMARAEAQGTIYVDKDEGTVKKATDYIKFDSLKRWILAYKAGVGAAMTFGNFIIGAGYELAGFGSIDKGKEYKDATVNYHEEAMADKNVNYTDNKNFDFAKITQMNHSIKAFAKMVF